MLFHGISLSLAKAVEKGIKSQKTGKSLREKPILLQLIVSKLSCPVSRIASRRDFKAKCTSS